MTLCCPFFLGGEMKENSLEFGGSIMQRELGKNSRLMWTIKQNESLVRQFSTHSKSTVKN